MGKDQLVDTDVTAELIDRAAEGDLTAFDSLLARHLPAVRQSAEKRFDPRLRSRFDLSDVVQETQQEATTRSAEYCRRRPMPFRLWLLKTAHERLVDLERKHLHAERRSVRAEVPLPDSSSLDLVRRLAVHAPGPQSHAMQQELAGQMRICLARLSDLDREILMLRCFEGLTNREVAVILELQPETTKKRFARAILKMQKELHKEGVLGADS